MVRIVGIDEVYLFSSTTDMRKGLNGLSSVISELFQDEERKTRAFVFLSKSHGMMKVIILEGEDAWMVTRRIPARVRKSFSEQQGADSFVLSTRDINDIFREIARSRNLD